MTNSCPKCGASRSGASCPKCGLVFAKYNSEIVEEGVTPEIRALWDAVEEKRDDETRHAVFVERALIADAGPFAASRYRQKKDDPIAEKYLIRISERLEQMLLATPRTEPRDLSRARMIGAMVAILILVGLAILFWFSS